MSESQNQPIHVAINAHLMAGDPSYRSAGVHQYIYHLLLYLPQAGCRITAFLGATGQLSAPGVAAHSTRWPTHRPAARVLWEQLAQPQALKTVGADLAHAPVYVGPLVAPCHVVVTVHDLSFIRYPHLFRPANRLYLRVFTRLSVRRARRVIAVSRHTAGETVRLLRIPQEKVHVVYHGVDPIFRPRPAEKVESFRRRHGLPERFLLFVGTLEPRKNLVRLIEAFARCRADAGTYLVLAGARGWYDEEIFATVERLGMGDRVLFPGHVPNAELPLWYNAATAFAYPSLYEGFGLPVLEALACGTPVLTSAASSLPEVAGDGALMVDPFCVEEIADGLHRLLTDESLRETVRRRGLENAARFTWPRTAAETVAVYQQALTGG